MQKQLRAITDSLESAQKRLRRLSDKISDREWNKHPGPGRWSAAECVEHLNITSRAFLPRLRDAVAVAKERGGDRQKHYRRDPLGWFMSQMIGPRRHLGKFGMPRINTLPKFTPAKVPSRKEILSNFVKLQAELTSLIRAGDGLPLDDVKIVSPFGDRMKYSAYSAFIILGRHQHRHIQQAEEAST